MFGIGLTELTIFCIIVLIIFGPSALPRISKSIVQTLKELKGAFHDPDDNSSS